MPFQITNTSKGPVLVRLRSGATLHLASGERSAALEDPEVRNNARLEPLLARRLITLEELVPKGREAGAGGSRGRSRARPARRPDNAEGADAGEPEAAGP